ncbi:MAG: hypothetical protein QOF36_2168 [Microbacteriaceae bacterium]|nr:hypothetical protein [Microbacteriaceae bacterium]
MSLTRKRKRELKRLRHSAEELWGQQQDILDRANSVAREASRQVNHLAKEEVAPRVRESYEHYVRPGMDVTGRLAHNAKARLVGDVIPAVGSAIGTAMSVVDHARDARVRAVLSAHAPKKIAKSGPSTGAYIAVGLGIVAAAGLLYAVWQTFRADDELWVADEEPTTLADLE